MKKIVLILVVLFALSGTMAFADHPGNGIGLVFGGGFGGYGYGDIGVTFKFSKLPIMWNAAVGINNSILRLGVSGDYYIIDQDLISDGGFNLDWFFGAGAYANFRLGDDFAFGVGGRLPIGLSWHIIKELELALSLVPQLGLFVDEDVDLGWGIGAELALRYWF